jgi:hypothetical protein
MKENIREQVLRRSQGNCEAMVRLDRAWVRCGKSPVDDHHVLPRSRGGSVLDSAGEIYHHLALCRTHHTEVDERGASSGLLIEGYVWTDAGGFIVYVGPDMYLSNRYGQRTKNATR